jgi:hypothetical protein
MNKESECDPKLMAAAIKINEKMKSKKPLIKKAYYAALQDELEKIAKTSRVKSADKNFIASSRNKDFNKAISKAEDDYSSTMKPYKKHRRVAHAATGYGGLIGLLAGLKKRKFRLTRALGGALAGSIAGGAGAHHTLGYVDPNYKKTINKAISNFHDAEDKAMEKFILS